MLKVSYFKRAEWTLWIITLNELFSARSNPWKHFTFYNNDWVKKWIENHGFDKTPNQLP